MESFSLLKYWRGGGGVGGGFISGGGGGESGDGFGANSRNAAATTTTIVTGFTSHAAEETDDDDEDDGSFFDLEFAVQDEAEEEEGKEDTNEDENENHTHNDGVSIQDDSVSSDEEGEEEREFNFTISSNSSGNNDCTDSNLTLSPSDDLFFKGNLVPIEPASLVLNSAEPNSKPSQFPASLLKSATKLRVSMLRFKKSKQNVGEKTEQDNGSVAGAAATTTAMNGDESTAPKQQQKQEAERQCKFFTVKFKVEEVPIMSLFTRDNNSSRKSRKQSAEDSEEKKFSKDVMQKYLKKVKPLYIRVSKRYGEKLKFSGQSNLGSVTKCVPSTLLTAGRNLNQPESTSEKSLPPQEADAVGAETLVKMRSQKQVNNIPDRLKVVCKQLGKSRSASSAVAAAPAAASGSVAASRRDDSLLQQQDGIQSAILHCKRSFNASRDSDSSLLARSDSNE